MNDERFIPIARAALYSGAATLIALASPAIAGDEVVYAAAPSWAEAYDLTPQAMQRGPSEVLYDWQHRMEGGVVTAYQDMAIRIANAETLAQYGTVSLNWLPDKGDLTVHQVSIIRGGTVIDVIANGTHFDVLRREQGLEQRLLDGQLTATMTVPGLKVGDVLRVRHSVSLKDQALGDEMQVTQFLPSKPWNVGYARAIVSWPASEDVFWRAEDGADIAPPKLVDGYRRLEVTLPIAKRPEMPADAPSRYLRPPVLRVGTYADWQELSRTMAPHFDEAAQVAKGSEVAEEAAGIMRLKKDPLERTAMALRLVQDDVSYLLNGLDGGNYLPQSAGDTWEKRYGDCKAKSVLLLALLRQMGIDAEVVLVASRGGDALPELLAMPANFDHMIVRARIDGVDYWLDGTSTGTRLSNLAEVPAFFHALPLTAQGSDLVPMTQRTQQSPDMAMAIKGDYSAGVDLPFLFDMTLRIYGARAAPFEALVQSGDADTLQQLATSFSGQAGAGSVSSVKVDYDDDAAMAVIAVKGVAESEFRWEDGRLATGKSVGEQALTFGADRARAEWRNIPVRTDGPARNHFSVETVLPKYAGAFTLRGPGAVNDRIGNAEIVVDGQLTGNRMTVKSEVIEHLGEIPASQVPEVKRAAMRLDAQATQLVAPADMVWRWEREPAELRRLTRGHVAALDEAVAFAGDDDLSAIHRRAEFFLSIYDWASALKDYDTLIERSPSAQLYMARAGVLESLGRNDAAIEDIRASYDLQPDNGTAFYLARMLAYEGSEEEAQALLADLPVNDAERGTYADTVATVSGLRGDTESGLATLASAVANKPQNGDLLNSDCWYRGLFNVGLDDAVEQCTRAVEHSEQTAPVLDSRAMVRYRLGQMDAALADLDAALAQVPGLAASLYLRGIIKLEKGDKAGRRDVDNALRISPAIASIYARHGVKPKP